MNYTKDLEDALVSLRDERDAAGARVSELEAENKTLKAAAEDVSEAYQLELADAAERTREIEALKARAEEAEEKLANLNAHLVSVIKRRDEAINDCEELSNENHDLRTNLEAANARAESADASAGKLRKALEIYAKPENWTPYKTQHRRIWIYHYYEDGFKIAAAALQEGKEAQEKEQ